MLLFAKFGRHTGRLRRPVVSGLRRLWGGWVKWPMPLWRLRGRGTITVGGERFTFCRLAQSPVGWWAWLARAGDYERPVIGFLKQELRPGDVFFDVGAFNGVYSLLGARRGARVIAFEPDQRSQDLFRCNARANALGCELVPAAVGRTSGTITVDAAHAGTLSSRAGVGGAPVEVVTLDEFCVARGVWPDVVKIDVEGAERDVIAGAATVLSRARVVVVEIHGQSNAEELLGPRFSARVLETRWGNVNVAFTVSSGDMDDRGRASGRC